MGKKRDAIKQVERADIAVTKKAAAARGTLVVRAGGALSKLSDQPPLIAFSIGIATAGVIRHDNAIVRGGLRMLASHLVATGLKTIVKRLVDRTRPQLLVDEGRYELSAGERNEGPFNSFPSGHTAGALAVARALARDFPETAPIGYSMSAIVGSVQIPRANHFTSDVAAGVLIGLAAEAAVSAGLDRLGARRAAIGS